MAGFVAFDTYKTLLQDEMGNISGPRTVIAGFGAGITESLLAVTPFESIKTTLCVTQPPLPLDLFDLLLINYPESTTGSQPTHECEVSFMALVSYSENAGSRVSSKVSCPQQRGRRLTLQLVSEVIRLLNNSRRGM